jgi:hypothetical protein
MSLERIVRGAIYADFVIRPLLRLSLIGTLVLVAGSIAAVALALLFDAQPWYNRDLIDGLASGPHAATWGDASDKAAKFFPAGMERDSAVALLNANGFSCSNGPAGDFPGAQVDVPADGGAAEVLTCGRELSQLVCLARYRVTLAFDGDTKVADRRASYYFACL